MGGAREGGGGPWVAVASGRCWVDGVGEGRLLWRTAVLLEWGYSAPPRAPQKLYLDTVEIRLPAFCKCC